MGESEFVRKAKIGLLGLASLTCFYFARQVDSSGNDVKVNLCEKGLDFSHYRLVHRDGYVPGSVGLENAVESDYQGFLDISSLDTYFDIGGCVYALGMGVKGKSAGLSVGVSLFTSQIPELVSLMDGVISGSQMMLETGKDALLVGGCYVLGRILSSGGSIVRRIGSIKNSYSSEEVKRSKSDDRSWWYGD